MADEREIAGWRQAYRTYSDEDLIRVMREKVSYCSEHIAAEQEFHSRSKAATEEARTQGQSAKSDIERRHREQLELAQAALQVTIQHHQETMANDQRVVDRQLRASGRASWIAAGIAILSALAAWVGYLLPRETTPAQAIRFESRLSAIEQRVVAAPTIPQATPAPQTQSPATSPPTPSPQAATPTPKASP